MSEAITGFVDVPCTVCDGVGAYWIVGTEGAQVPARGEIPAECELIDPCDYCHGNGTIPAPVTDGDRDGASSS